MKANKLLNKKSLFIGIMISIFLGIIICNATVQYRKTGNAKTAVDGAVPIATNSLIESALAKGRGNTGYQCDAFIYHTIMGVTGVTEAPQYISSWSSNATITYNGTAYNVEQIASVNKAWGEAWYAHIDMSKLQPGDVICGTGHMMLYLGEANSYAELKTNIASKLNTDENSLFNNIAYKEYSSSDTVGCNYWVIEGNTGATVPNKRTGAGPFDNGVHDVPFIRNYAWNEQSSESGQSNNMCGTVAVYRVSVQNSGSYHIYLGKRAAANKDTAVAGVTYNVKKYKNNAGAVTKDINVTTALDGDDYAEGNKCTKVRIGDKSDNNWENVIDNTDEFDKYEITETSVPEGYAKTNKKVIVQVYKKLDGTTYKIDYVKAYINGYEGKAVDVSTDGKAYYLDAEGNSVEENEEWLVQVDASTGALAVHWANAYEGQYKISVDKKDSVTGASVSGAELYTSYHNDDSNHTNNQTNLTTNGSKLYLSSANEWNNETANCVNIKSEVEDVYAFKEETAPAYYKNCVYDGYVLLEIHKDVTSATAKIKGIDIYQGEDRRQPKITNTPIVPGDTAKTFYLKYENENLSVVETKPEVSALVGELAIGANGASIDFAFCNESNITGEFKINLVKHIKGETTPEGQPKPLAGAKFKVKVHDGTKYVNKNYNEEIVTDSDGTIPTIDGINIEAENITYTITVEETYTPENYIGLAEPVVFTAKSVSENGTYKLEVEEKKQIENDFFMEVKANEIAIEVENRVEPVIHKGVKSVENQDSGYDKNEIQTWVINTTIPTGIAQYTKYVVTDEIDAEKTNVEQKRLAFINEDHPEQNVVVKYKGTDTVLTEGTDYKVVFNKATKVLTITFINEPEGENSFVGGRALTEGTTLEITYKTQFALDGNGNIIGINQSIPNQADLTFNGNGRVDGEKTKRSETPEVHTGGIGIYKFDASTNKALAGAKFRLTKSKTEAEKAVQALLENDEETFSGIDWVKKYNSDGTVGEVWEETTNAEGYAEFKGLEFGEDASVKEANKTTHVETGATIYKYNESLDAAKTLYYVVETYVPEEYVLLEEIAVEAEVGMNTFDVTDLTSYHKVGNEVVVPEGGYNVEVVKYGRYQEESEEKELHAIEGVVFSAKRAINGLDEESLGTLAATDSTGTTQVGSVVTIDRAHVSTNDVYKIKEESVPADSEYYLGFDKEIKLIISKKSEKSEDKKKFINSVTGIVMEIDDVNVTKVIDGKKYTAKVTKDGQELEITAELAQSNGGTTIRLTVENPRKNGDFRLNIIKTEKGTGTSAKRLSGAGFKVSIKNGDEALVDKNKNVVDGTHEYFVNNNGELVIEGLNIKEQGITYNVEIEESTVPSGYTGIADKIKYSVTSKLDGNKFILQDANDLVVSNDVLVNVKDGEIWNYVQNSPEPVIHKGVKSVENQDSGYDKNEIQTWVINTTIPTGIAKYTKYVVTDEIDAEKTNVEQKRLAFINEDHPEQNVVVKYKGTDTVLTEGTDYRVVFNKATKVLTITFINEPEGENSFIGGRNLTEGATLEITFNTKFALDENGNIIGINQSIPNQSHLTFNQNGRVDGEKTKDSETPEVHTGGVGVFKYDDANKNGQYDEGEKALEGAHFRITKSENEAQKAVAIILKYEAEGKTKEELEEALKQIDFVKEKSADGKETEKALELVTGKDGRAEIEGLEFGEDAINKVKVEYTGVDGAPVYAYKWDEAETKYYLVETETPDGYLPLEESQEVTVKAKNYDNLNLTKYYEVANKPKIYDLSLRKFITQVEDKEITDREPQVTLTDEFKDDKNDKVTTAKYEHTKEPIVVQQGNTVTYTIRIYNEGPNDAYASIVKDDIPDGVEFVQYKEGDGSINDEYRWKLVDDKDNEVTDASKAKYIVTDYLSMEQGEVGEDGRNSNLLKKFDSKTMDKLDYRDIKVQFKVLEPNTSDRILINYAQISEEKDSEGRIVTDRDSIPNVWNEGEDDQDIEKIKLLYFDLALRKWVTKAFVTENGQTVVYETGHKAEDDPEDVVKVDLKKSKVDSVVVKFEYQIRVTNEGKIGGWAEELTDHIPDGLKFDQADNPIWTRVDDKTITTDALKDVYLEPGESAEVTVVLTWINSASNLGIKTNIAEISKDRNEYGSHDIDSTPGNYKYGEDDIDDAPVMLSIKTGNETIRYVILSLAVLSIIAVGAKMSKGTSFFDTNM